MKKIPMEYSADNSSYESIVRDGAMTAQRLGATRDSNPYSDNAHKSLLWLSGYDHAEKRLNELFLAWLALGHSIPKLAIGKAGQALGPMVAGLVASNGNTAGALLVGALASHDGRNLRDILPDPESVRNAFESTQYGITGHEMPEGGLPYFYQNACKIDLFREPGTETEIASPDGKSKVARVKFDLAGYLQALVEGLPEEENVVDFGKGEE